MAAISFGQVKVVTSGDVKIGNTTVTPTAKLHVDGNTFSGGPDLFRADDGTAGYFRVRDGLSGGGIFLPLFEFAGSGIAGTSGGFRSLVADDASAHPTLAAMTIIAAKPNNAFLTNSHLFMIRNGIYPQLTMNGNGNVGLGVTTATQKLHVNGNVVANNVSAPSDKRLKKNISNFKFGLNEILSIRPVSFQYNGNGGIEDTETTHIGVIAQEFQKISPSSISMIKLEENREEVYNSIGDDYENLNKSNVDFDYKEYLSVNDKSITYMLVNAIQEQQSIIDDQNDRLLELENIVRALVDNTEGKIQIELDAFERAEIGLAYPNPTATSTQIDYNIPADSKSVTINVIDINGSVIRTEDIVERGKGTLTIDMANVPSSTYSYQLVVDNKVIATRKVVVAK